MAAKQILSIHHGRNGIFAVLLEKRGEGYERGPVFQVERPTDPQIDPEGNAIGELARQLAREQRRVPVVVSLGGAYYQTLTHHSEFSDPRHILQTLRFDIEEETVFEAENLAVCFETATAAVSGADLVVYAADRGHLASVLDQYEKAGLDPLMLEPDTASWLHYLTVREQIAPGQAVLVAGWADGMLHLLALDKDRRPILSRGLFCPDPAQADAMLVTELQRSLLISGEGRQPQQLCYHAHGFTREQIGRLGQEFNIPCEPLSEADPRIAFALGGGLGYAARTVQADFRLDGMPVASQMVAKRRALLGLSAAATFLLISLLFMLQVYTGHYRTLADQALEQTHHAYRDVTGETPSPSTPVTRRVRTTFRQLRDQQGERDQRSDTASATNGLTLVLQALASLGYDFDLQVDSLRVFPDASTLAGSIPDLQAQFRLDEAIKATPQLVRESWNFEGPVGGRRPFSVNLRVVKPNRPASQSR